MKGKLLENVIWKYMERVLVARGKTILGQESIESYINYIFQELFIVLFSPSDFDSPFFFFAFLLSSLMFS